MAFSRRCSGRDLPDPVWTVPAWALRHDDALHGDLGLHVRHRNHSGSAAARTVPGAGHTQGGVMGTFREAQHWFKEPSRWNCCWP